MNVNFDIKGIKGPTTKTNTIVYTIKLKSNLKMQFWCNWSHSLLIKVMQYQEVPKNKYTQFGIKTESIAREYYKNTQNPHHKNLTVQTCGFLVKQEFSHLGDIIRCNYFTFMSQKACT